MAASTSSGTDTSGTDSADPTEGTSSGGAPDCGTGTGEACDPPQAPVLALDFTPIKQFDFSWAAVAEADYYQLEQSPAPGAPFVPLGGDIVGTEVSHAMPLHLRQRASHRLRACNADGCTSSAIVDVTGTLAEAVGYVKASNAEQGDYFGRRVALSADGSTLAVSAYGEDSDATGIDGDQTNNGGFFTGAVYVFGRDDAGAWSQQAYIKASNPDDADGFGIGLGLSADGNTLAVGAHGEDSNATGIDGDQGGHLSTFSSGAAYVFVRDDMGAWSQQAYLKASNTDGDDRFGEALALSADGNTLAVAAPWEDSNATGIDGDQANDAATESGAVYVFVRNGTWSQQAYVKASNTDATDYFGSGLALSGDGNTLAVGAYQEDSDATGIDGDQASDAATNAGAVYVLTRDAMGSWEHRAYVKTTNTAADDRFGHGVALSTDATTLAAGAFNEGSGTGAIYVFVHDGLGEWAQQARLQASNADVGDWLGASVALGADGNILAAGAQEEDGNATGIDGDPTNDAAASAGAAYVFVRDGMGTWSQQAYVKASNTGLGERFGHTLALAADGSVLAVAAQQEDGSSTGIGGDPSSNGATSSGAVYLY